MKGGDTMRRNKYPFNGYQFVLNKNTCEVHDLDQETPSCKINDIKSDHVFNCKSYKEACIYAAMFKLGKCNGCAYCMPEENTD